MSEKIPPPVIHRMLKYLSYVTMLCERKTKWVSSARLADVFALTSVTVRHDMCYLKNFFGVQKRGYDTGKLAKILYKTLKFGDSINIVIIGAGGIAYTLATHEKLLRDKFRICGIFDSGSHFAGKKMGCFSIQGHDELQRVICNNNVDIGVVTAAEGEAQHAADLLVAAGIRGILNLTSVQIRVPEEVKIIDDPIFTSLLKLSCLIYSKNLQRDGKRRLTMAEKILIVDDDYDFVSITKSQIEKGGYEVEVAYNGEECLEKVRKNKPELIILDVMMPGLNGYDTCAELKSDEKTRYIPVILLTAVVKNLRTTTYTQRQGLETEADDYLAKPPEPEVLLGTIKKFIRR